MSTRTLTGIRPSLWARCPTAAVFRGRGEMEADLPDEVREYFFRGNVFEEIVMRQIEAKHGKHNVQRQVVIPIPGIGEGHADGYLIPERALIEVKSTVAPYPNSPTFEFGVRQLQRYIAYHPEAGKGYLYLLDPNRMKPADVYTVVLTDEDREAIEAERDYIISGVSGGELHLDEHGGDWRPCTRPSQARGRMCQLAAVCFDGWEADPAEEITDPLALDAASRLKAIKDEKRIHAAAVRALEEGEKQAQAELAEYVEPGEAIVGPFSVKRTHVVRQPTFQVKAYTAAGHSLEPIAEFFKEGSEYDKWTVSEAAEDGDIDYGEAPW